MSKSLPEFIADVGAEEAARLFNVKQRTAESWKRRERYPRPAKAPEIIEASGGIVDYEGIYGPESRSAAA